MNIELEPLKLKYADCFEANFYTLADWCHCDYLISYAYAWHFTLNYVSHAEKCGLALASIHDIPCRYLLNIVRVEIKEGRPIMLGLDVEDVP